jgi:hypothetical protein
MPHISPVLFLEEVHPEVGCKGSKLISDTLQGVRVGPWHFLRDRRSKLSEVVNKASFLGAVMWSAEKSIANVRRWNEDVRSV